MFSFAFAAQLFAWGQAIYEKGRPLADDVIAAFKKHGVESDRAVVFEAVADAKARKARREAELTQPGSGQ